MKNRIGIVGGGQLGRMLTMPAKQMGFTVTILDPTPRSPAGQVADYQIAASYDDEEALIQLATQSDYLTFEIELANPDLLIKIARMGVMVNPSADTLLTIKDKLNQKQFLERNQLPVAPFLEISSPEDIAQVGKTFGYPFLLKARFGGYDGRGNAVVSSEQEGKGAFQKLGGKLLYAERYVPFTKELAVMVARDIHGTIVSYPVVETIHKDNICHVVKVPAPIPHTIQSKARTLAESVLTHLDGAGVFGIEMFLAQDETVLINEIAPRVHNSGHYTIEACMTSQFEQHIRCIAGLPLGSTEMKVPAAVMGNILGNRYGEVDVHGLDTVLKTPGLSVHVYGKEQTKPQRKMGHVTAVGKSLEVCEERVMRALSSVSL